MNAASLMTPQTDDALAELEQIRRYLAAHGHGWVALTADEVRGLRARRDQLLMQLPQVPA